MLTLRVQPNERPEVSQKPPALARSAVIPRKVEADLNSDDEIIYRMKLDGQKDQEIAQFLRDSGRIDYHPKTIRSRFTRINMVKDEAMDRALEKGRSKWDAVNVSASIQSSMSNQLSCNRTKDCLSHWIQQNKPFNV